MCPGCTDSCGTDPGATSVVAIVLEDSHDHSGMDPSGMDPSGTDPVSTVAHQNGPPNDVPTLLLEHNLYHLPAGASNKESLSDATSGSIIVSSARQLCS